MPREVELAVYLVCQGIRELPGVTQRKPQRLEVIDYSHVHWIPHKYNILLAIWYHIFKANMSRTIIHYPPILHIQSHLPVYPLLTFHSANTNETDTV